MHKNFFVKRNQLFTMEDNENAGKRLVSSGKKNLTLYDYVVSYLSTYTIGLLLDARSRYRIGNIQYTYHVKNRIVNMSLLEQKWNN